MSAECGMAHQQEHLRRHASSEREKIAAQYSVNPSIVTVPHGDRFQ
jgi:hypothetical protein